MKEEEREPDTTPEAALAGDVDEEDPEGREKQPQPETAPVTEEGED